MEMIIHNSDCTSFNMVLSRVWKIQRKRKLLHTWDVLSFTSLQCYLRTNTESQRNVPFCALLSYHICYWATIWRDGHNIDNTHAYNYRKTQMCEKQMWITHSFDFYHTEPQLKCFIIRYSIYINAFHWRENTKRPKWSVSYAQHLFLGEEIVSKLGKEVKMSH